jgi:hypothetical protein
VLTPGIRLLSYLEESAATVAEPLSAEAVALIVKRRAQLAGLEGDFGAHSLRSGFVTEAGRQNIPLGDTMAMTGHRSIQTVMRYFQTGAIGQTRAARLLGDDPPSGRGPPILLVFSVVCLSSPNVAKFFAIPLTVRRRH